MYVSCERLLELAQLGNSLSRFMEESEKEGHAEKMKNVGLSEKPPSIPQNLSRSSLDDMGDTINVVGNFGVEKSLSSQMRSFSMEDLPDDKLISVNNHDDSASETSSCNKPVSFSIGGDSDDSNHNATVNSNVKVTVSGPDKCTLTPAQVAAALGATMYEDATYDKAAEYEVNK